MLFMIILFHGWSVSILSYSREKLYKKPLHGDLRWWLMKKIADDLNTHIVKKSIIYLKAWLLEI